MGSASLTHCARVLPALNGVEVAHPVRRVRPQAHGRNFALSPLSDALNGRGHGERGQSIDVIVYGLFPHRTSSTPMDYPRFQSVELDRAL